MTTVTSENPGRGLSGSRIDITALYEEQCLYVRKLVFKLSQKYSDIVTEDDREDIEQAVWLKICNGAMDNFRGECKVTSYLGYIVTSCVSDHVTGSISHRKESLDLIPETADCNDDADDRMYIESIIDAVIGEVKTMPHRNQVIFIMTLKNIQQEIIAEKLDLRQPTISEHWSNIKKQLQQMCRQRFPESEIDLEALLCRIMV